MLKVSDAFNSAFAAPDRELRARVTIGKTVYDSDDLTSINYDSGAMTGEQFSIGSTYMNSTKITFSHLVEGLKQLDEVLLEFGIVKADGTTEYVKMGTFIIDDKIQMDRNNNSTTIECMDRMVMLGGAYKSKLSYPATIKSVAVEIANMAGVRVNDTSFARLPNQSINEPIGYSYRDAIGIIAQFAMGFALFDRDGYLDIRTLVDSEFKIDPSQYFLKGLVKNETFFKLNGISCTVVTTSKDENGNETSKTTVLQSGSSSGSQIKLANNVMTQDVLDRMYESLKFTNYYPFTLNWNGNPAVEAGDWLTLEDMQGNEFKVPNMSYTLTFNGGLTASSKAETSTNSSVTYSYGGSMSNIVNEIGGREGAEGNHIYEGTEDQKPLFPKEGDLWYKHVGPDTEERIYKDGKWEFLTSTKTANDAADAADKASKEAEEAKKTANESVAAADDAVGKANQAVEDAGFANSTASDAKTAAANAQKDATGALSDAKKALTNSNSAMADSTQARKDSATAIKDAADSLTSAKDAINKVGNLTTSVTSQFTTVNNELKSKVNQTDYDKLKGTVTSQQTEINQNASGIKLKADKSYADTINNSVVKNTSSIGLLNNQIALTVSKTELNNTLSSYATQTWTQSQIKSTADQINLSVTKVDQKVDGLTVGTRNYLIGSDVIVGATKIQQLSMSVAPDFFNAEKSVMFSMQVDYDNFTVDPGQKNRYVLEVEYVDNKGTTNWINIVHTPTAGASFHGRVHASRTIPNSKGITKWNGARLFNQSSTPNGTVSKPMIEIATMASDWAEAPEDSASSGEFANLEITVNGIQGTVQNKADKSQVTQLSDQISLKADTTAVNTLKGTVDKQGSVIDVNTKAIALKASQSIVDTLTGRVSTAEGKITVQADQITQTVSKTELTSKLDGYATQTWSEGKISAAKNEIKASVETVKQTVDNWRVGGTNLAPGTSADWQKVSVQSGWGTADLSNKVYEIKDGETYTLQVEARNITSPIILEPFYFTATGARAGLLAPKKGADKDGKIIITFTANLSENYAYFMPNLAFTSGLTGAGSYEYRRFKLETGTMATDWSPAPEDQATVDWTKSLLDVSEGKVSAQVQSVKTDLTNATNTLNNNIANATAGMATQTWTQGKLDLTADGLTSQISSVQDGLNTKYTSLEQTLKGVQITANNAVTQSQYTQLADSINLRVQNGDVINQINISPESILIAGQKVHITGQTAIDNAVIKDAMIADIRADKITAGTLNAANVNVINLNANNITTGTIKGANLAINLNTGEVTFQKGRIHSASNNIDINIDQGYVSVANDNARVMMKNGGIQFVQPNIFDDSTNPYLSISNGGSGLAFTGARIVGRDYIVIANSTNSDNIFDRAIGGAETFAGISVGFDGTTWHPTKIGGAERGILLSGGARMSTETGNIFGSSPNIIVGSNGSSHWFGNRIAINGEFVHIISAYRQTASGSANLMVAQDGALVRSTSASKYKTDIIRTNIPDYGEKLLELPTATWVDIAETKRYRDDPTTQPEPTRNFGMIAEDLADAGLEMLVVRGADGELEGINYDRIGPALIPVIAKLKNEVEILKQKLEEKTA